MSFVTLKVDFRPLGKLKREGTKEELGRKSAMCTSVGRVGLPGDWCVNSPIY